MDLEELTRGLYREGKSKVEICNHLIDLGISKEFSSALFTEIENSENLKGMKQEIKDLIIYQSTGLHAGETGLGSRGVGDFTIHECIGKIADSPGVVIGPSGRDDGGVVRTKYGNFLIVSVDGLHSRLGHFPFLAGFHVARACLRDILVMGAKPVALFSDVHIGNDGDPAKILDYTAGISTVGEAVDVPLVAGSTLRIAGDLVTGGRLSGAAGAVGLTNHITPRKMVQPGDVLIMTLGSGGGTISATAIFNGRGDVLEHTLNLDFIALSKAFLDDPLSNEVHAMTDITNGGIRGDLHEISQTAGVDITLYPNRFLSLINPQVLSMLEDLHIDPFGVSIDSLLIACSPHIGDGILTFLRNHGASCDIIGIVKSGPGRVFIDNRHQSTNEEERNIKELNTNNRKAKEVNEDGMTREIKPLFREASYTPVKKVVEKEKIDPHLLRSRMEEAMNHSLKKKEWLINRLRGSNMGQGQ